MRWSPQEIENEQNPEAGEQGLCLRHTVLREKPHFSAPGDPFMKSMTGACRISFPSLSLRSSGLATGILAGAGTVGMDAAGRAGAPPPALRAMTCALISGAFAPTIPPTFSPPCTNKSQE